MNHLTNEHGDIVPAVGAEGSHARVKAKCPITLHWCIELLVSKSGRDFINAKNPVWQAARFYIDNPGCYLPDVIPEP